MTTDMNTTGTLTRTQAWTVTLRVGANKWTTTTVSATDHEAAIATARRLIGRLNPAALSAPCTEIV